MTEISIMPYKLVMKRGCSKKDAMKRPHPLCFKVYSPQTKKHYSKNYMPYDKASRQLAYLNTYLVKTESQKK
jgi:hypothetical protein